MAEIISRVDSLPVLFLSSFGDIYLNIALTIDQDRVN